MHNFIGLILQYLIGDDIRTIERNSDASLNACKDIGLAVNTGKTKYMEIGRHRGMIANEHIKIGSSLKEVLDWSPMEQEEENILE